MKMCMCVWKSASDPIMHVNGWGIWNLCWHSNKYTTLAAFQLNCITMFWSNHFHMMELFSFEKYLTNFKPYIQIDNLSWRNLVYPLLTGIILVFVSTLYRENLSCSLDGNISNVYGRKWHTYEQESKQDIYINILQVDKKKHERVQTQMVKSAHSSSLCTTHTYCSCGL